MQERKGNELLVWISHIIPTQLSFTLQELQHRKQYRSKNEQLNFGNKGIKLFISTTSLLFTHFIWPTFQGTLERSVNKQSCQNPGRCQSKPRQNIQGRLRLHESMIYKIFMTSSICSTLINICSMLKHLSFL